MPRWEGRGGVGIAGYFNNLGVSTRPANYKNVLVSLEEEKNHV